MTLQEELHVILLYNDRKSSAEIAQEIQQSISNVDRIIAYRGRITKYRAPNLSRRFLEMSGELKIICRAECGEPRKDICEDSRYHHEHTNVYCIGRMQGKQKGSVTVR